MDKKYIELINQLIQGYHMEKSELDNLENYLKSQLRQIELRKGTQEKTIQLIVYKESKTVNGQFLYTCKLVINNQIIHLKNDINFFKCIKRVNNKTFSFTVSKTNLSQFTLELEKYYNNKIILIRLV